MLKIFKSFKEKKINLKEASELSGYSADHIGSLIRTSKIIGHRLIGTSAWVTTEAAVLNYLRENTIGRMSTKRRYSLARIENDKPEAPSPVRLPLFIIEVISAMIILSTVFGMFYTFYIYSAIRDKVGERSSISQPGKK